MIRLKRIFSYSHESLSFWMIEWICPGMTTTISPAFTTEYENILFNLDMLVSRQCDYDTVSFFNGIAGFKGYCTPVISKTAQIGRASCRERV